MNFKLLNSKPDNSFFCFLARKWPNIYFADGPAFILYLYFGQSDKGKVNSIRVFTGSCELKFLK